MNELKVTAGGEDEMDELTRTWLEKPGDERVLFEMGLAHQLRANLPQSVLCYEMALCIAPTMGEALANQAAALKELGYFELALQRLHLANQNRPQDPVLINNLGAVLVCLGRQQEALDCYSKSLAISPSYEEALINKGFAQSELMHIEAAIETYREVLALNPSSLQAQFNLSLLMLLLGHQEQGWTLYESRLRLPKNANSYPWLSLELAIWSGLESIKDRVLWVHAEQGLGDTLQFCREALSLIELGAEVVLSVPQALLKVVRTMAQALPEFLECGRFSVICEDSLVGHADYQIALMSVPLALMRHRKVTSFIPRGVPYLFSEEVKQREFERVLGPKTALRVALVWSGGHRAELPSSWALNDRRNISLNALGELRALNVEWFSLQMGSNSQSELATFNDHASFLGVRDLSPWIEDFSDTAALASLMDLVITVDTSVAHLVGALGKPVWILHRFDVCWRWSTEGSSTLWYPSARLFRQSVAGDWSLVAQEVYEALEKWSSHEACTLTA